MADRQKIQHQLLVSTLLLVMLIAMPTLAAQKRAVTAALKPTIRECVNLQKRILREIPAIKKLCENVHGNDRCVVIQNGIQSYVQEVNTFTRRERCPSCTADTRALFLPYPLNDVKANPRIARLADTCTDEYGM